MTKTFLRTTYMFFLWIILFVNIIYAFNLVGIVVIDATLTSPTIDFQDKYFGVSTLIRFFQNLDKYISIENNALFKHYKDMSELAQNMFDNSNEWFVGKDKNWWDWIANGIIQVVNIIGGVIVYIYSWLILAMLWMYMIVVLFFALLKLISGYSYETLPSTVQQLSELILIL